MIAKNLIVAAAVFVSATGAFAAEAPAVASAGAAAAAAASTAGAATAATAARLNLPTLGAPIDASRDEVKADAADALKDYRTTLSVQLDQYKN